MAKFCTKCGKKLEDGKPCDCENKENKKVEEVEAEVVNEVATEKEKKHYTTWDAME